MQLTPESVLAKFKGIKEPYKVECLGKELWILPGVLDPTMAYLSEALAKTIQGEFDFPILDMGCGCGIDAILAAECTTEQVEAVDINPRAIVCTQINAELHGFGNQINTYQSDCFDNVSPHKKFGLIYFSLPGGFNYKPKHGLETAMGGIERSVTDYQHRVLEKFLRQARGFLLPDGKIRTALGAVDGSYESFCNLTDDYGYTRTLLSEFSREGTRFMIYELGVC